MRIATMTFLVFFLLLGILTACRGQEAVPLRATPSDDAAATAIAYALYTSTPAPTPTSTSTPGAWREAVDEYLLWCESDEYQDVLEVLNDPAEVVTYQELIEANELWFAALDAYAPPALLKPYHDAFKDLAAVALVLFREEPPSKTATAETIQREQLTDQRSANAIARIERVSKAVPDFVLHDLSNCP